MSTEVRPLEPDKPAIRKLSLRKNFSWTFVGHLLHTVARWGMLLVLVKLGDVATVGVYSLGLAVCQPISFLTSLHLRPALVTDTRNEYSYGLYIGLRLAGAALTVLIAAVVVFTAGYEPSTKLIIILISVGVAITSVREIFLGIMQKHECMDLSGQSQIILSFAAFLVFATAFWITGSLVWAIVGLLGTRSSLLLFRDIPKARAVVGQFADPAVPHSLWPDWSLGKLRTLCLRVLPLGLAITIGSFTNNVQHYFLKGYHGDALLGYYGVMAAITQAVAVLTNTLGVAASPQLAKAFASDRRRFVRLLLRVLGITAGLGAAGVLMTALVGKPLLSIMFAPDYAFYATEFIWMAVAMAFMFLASMLIYAMMAARAFLAVLCAGIAAAVVSVVTASLLVPEYGVQGAAWARTAAAAGLLLATAVATFIVTRRTTAPQAAACTPLDSEVAE